jgi:hypothetical protein
VWFSLLCGCYTLKVLAAFGTYLRNYTASHPTSPWSWQWLPETFKFRNFEGGAVRSSETSWTSNWPEGVISQKIAPWETRIQRKVANYGYGVRYTRTWLLGKWAGRGGGHRERMQRNRFSKSALFHVPNGKRNRRRPRNTWDDQFLHDVRKKWAHVQS